MKRIYLILLASSLSLVGFGQTAASYNFTALTGTFASISATGTAVASGISTDDGTVTSIPIGFTFNFCGAGYSTLSANANGRLSLSNNTSTAWTNSTANIAGAGFLMAFWDDLYGVGCTAYYQTTGASPNRIFTFQWNVWGNLAGSGTKTFQVKLYESTNIVEYWYGAGAYSGNSATIGIANSITDYKTLNNSTATPTAAATFTTTIATSPANGQIYRWYSCPVTASATNSGPACPGGTINLTGVSTGTIYSWTGPGGFTSTLLSPTVTGITTGGTYVLSASNGSCASTASTIVVLNPVPPAPVVTPSVATICNGGSVTLTATVPSGAVNLVPVQSWETGVPVSPGTPVNGWTTTAASTAYITQATAGTFPAAGPQSGTYFADFHSWSYSGITAALISPSFSMASITGGQIVFWVYRDVTAYNSAAYNNEGITIYANTTPAVAGGTNLGYVPRRGGFGISGGVTGTSTTTTSGWYQYTCTIPATFTGGTNYILFNFVSLYGDDVYLDNISITGNAAVAPPTWTPITDLYTNPSFTTAYTAGTPALNVYVHPTTTVSTTVTSYIATTTNGICTSSDTSIITVNPGLPAISGATTVCVGANITLANASAGGTWTSSNASVATVNPSTGVVTGVTTGVDTIYYTVTGCSAFKIINVVNGTPITGSTFALCAGGSNITLSNVTTGGTWSSGSTAVASINASGVVTSGTAGVTIITYTAPSGCSDTASVVVVAPPPAISGTASVCYAGGTTVLSDSLSGGTWSSSNPSVATVDAAGVVTGLASGSANIIYTIPPGCFTTMPLTLNPFPASITGATAVCEAGSMTTLSDATAAGIWSSSNPGAATVNASGVVTGVAAGSTVIAYTLPTGCAVNTTVTVNPLPANITGVLSVCQGAVTPLADTSAGGAWTSGNLSVATIDAVGNVSGVTVGNAVITYMLPTTCLVTATVTVDPLPGAIMGTPYLCFGSTTALNDTTPGGTWSSSTTSVATVDAAGTVYGAGAGNTTITYTANGCYSTQSVTVNPLVPAGITLNVNPSTTVCAGTSVTYTPTITNGGTSPMYVWSVNNVILSGASSYSYTPADGDLVRCWFISSYACASPDTASAWVTMTVNPIVTPALSLTTGMGDTVCLGVMTTISAVPVAGGTAPTYQWFVNLVSVGTAASYSYVPANGDIITVNMTSNAPCRTASTASASKILTVSPYVTPAVTLNPDLGPTICDGNPVTYVATQVNGGTAPLYQWSVNGVNTGVGPVYTYLPANSDMVQVTLTSNFPCVTTPTATNSVVMTVIPVVTPIGAIAVSPGYIVTAGTTVTFTASIVSGGGTAPVYQWLVNSIPIAGATNNVYVTSTLNDGDSVSCEITNTDLCSGITTFQYVHMTIGSNVGVQHVGVENRIVLSPNPNNGSFTIKGTLGVSDDEVMIEITNMVGQIVYSNKVLPMNGELNERITLNSSLAGGMYILNLRSQNTSSVIHFVVE